MTETNEGTTEHDAPVEEAKPKWRPMALALVAASSARFSDWDTDRVLPVVGGSED